MTPIPKLYIEATAVAIIGALAGLMLGLIGLSVIQIICAIVIVNVALWIQEIVLAVIRQWSAGS